jgi:hypothetical protein
LGGFASNASDFITSRVSGSVLKYGRLSCFEFPCGLEQRGISTEFLNMHWTINVKASAKKNKDELFEQIKYNDKYIKELCVGESIQYILASDDQLIDLER